MKIRKSRVIGGNTVVVHCDERFAPQADSLLEVWAGLEGKGKGVAGGVSLRFGPAFFVLRQVGTELVVHQPDVQKDPANDLTDDVSSSLWAIAAQMQVGRTVGALGKGLDFRQKIVIPKDRMRERRLYVRNDGPPAELDSGWSVGTLDGPEPTAGDFTAVPIYDLFRLRPSLIPLLGLPVGYLAVVDGDELSSIANEKDEEVWSSHSGIRQS